MSFSIACGEARLQSGGRAKFRPIGESLRLRMDRRRNWSVDDQRVMSIG